jgi:hypothetical protein
LNPDHPVNAHLRERGAGLVPNVVAMHDAERRATLAAGGVAAQFDVPYGWHVIDDGKRTLIFEPANEVQISLNLIPRQKRSNKAILDAIEAEARASYPNPEFLRLKSGRIHALGVRNIHDADQPLEQYHMLIAGRDQQTVLRARITATPGRAAQACNLAELILESVVFDPGQRRDESARSRDDLPAWWRRALALEAEGRLEEAEETIIRGAQHIGGASSVARMYSERMVRLRQAGDEPGALGAFRKAEQWINYYASQATSGGEGTALSAERDRFLAELVALHGYDPR